MNIKHYILTPEKEVVEASAMEWAIWLEKAGNDRIVARDHVGTHFVSTVFLGLDHNWSEEGPPLVFETMVFKDEDMSGEEQWRCSTYQEALTMHERALLELKAKYWLEDKL